MNYRQLVLSGITLFFALFFNLVTAYAQQVSSAPQSPSPTPGSNTAIASDYQLPYPGMLPDNPLYFIKELRDNLTAFFLSKPLDKADFALLQSDKNVQASYLLVTREAGKSDLAWKTLSSAQDSFAQAITQTENAKKQGYNTQEIAKKLDSANQKHLQVLRAIALQTQQQGSKAYKKELSRTETFTSEIKALR